MYYVDTAKLEQVNNGVYFLQIYGSDVTLNLYEYLTYDEMLDFVSKQFVPLDHLVKAYHIFNPSTK